MTTDFSQVLDALADMSEAMPEARELLTAIQEAARNLSTMREPGWRELGSASADQWVAQQIDREEINQKARWYYYSDPIPAQAVHLHNAYVFGRGIGYKAADPDVQAWLDQFWKNPRNQHSISRALAQHTLNRDRQLDGQLFFALYTSTLTGRVTVRTFDPSEIPADGGIVTMPGDRTFPIYFRRTYQPERYDFAQGRYQLGPATTQYIPDWRNAGPHPAAVQWPGGTEVHCMHVLTNPLGGYGLSHLAQGIPWVKAFKGFMEDRVTLTLALATFAFVQKVKGNRQAVQRLVEQWGQYETDQRYGIGDGRERRQGANTIVQNEASNLEQLKTDSGASNAYTDARMLKQNAGIGSGGIFEHYFGDPATGNLATATAMELPMLKLFEFEQQIWEDIFEDMFQFIVIQGLRFGPPVLRGKANLVVDESGGSPIWAVEPLEGVDLGIEVITPNIVQSDVAVWMAALGSIAGAEQATGQQIVPPKQKALKALQILGFDNAGEIVAEMEADDFQMAAKPAPADAGAELGAALGEAFAQKLREAVEKPKDIGDPLPKAEAEKVKPITKAEIKQAFEEFANLPALEDLLKELGLTIEDVDEAAAPAAPAAQAAQITPETPVAGVSNETPGAASHA